MKKTTGFQAFLKNIKTDKKKLLLVGQFIVILLLMVVLAALNQLVKQKQILEKRALEETPNNTVFSLNVIGKDSNQFSIFPGDTFKVSMYLGNGNSADGGLSAVDVILDFDLELLELTNITPKPECLDRANNSCTLQTFLPLKNDGSGQFDANHVISEANRSGKITFGAAIFDWQNQTINNPQMLEVDALITLEFLALEDGVGTTSTISFDWEPGKTTDSNAVLYVPPGEDKKVVDVLKEPTSVVTVTIQDEIAEQQLCIQAGGTWKEFADSCADTCEYHRNEDVYCATVMTYGCDCGEGKCWNGKECEIITSPLPDPTNTPVPIECSSDDDCPNGQVCHPETNLCIKPECSNADDCDDDNECTQNLCINAGEYNASCSHPNKEDGISCNSGEGICQNGECVAEKPPLDPSDVSLSIKTSLDGVPYTEGETRHHPQEHGQEVLIQITLLSTTSVPERKTVPFVYSPETGAYQTKQPIVYSDLDEGAYIIALKGPMHLATRYCYHGQQASELCHFQDLVNMTDKEGAIESNFIWLEPGENILDLSAQPIIAGDLPISGTNQNTQDGVVDIHDYSFVLACLGENRTTDSCVSRADLNFSGQVDNIDLMLLRRTLSRAADQL